MAYCLENLFNFHNEADVKNGCGKLNMTKMAGTDLDILFTCRAREHAVNGAEFGVVQTLLPRLVFFLVLSRTVSTQKRDTVA